MSTGLDLMTATRSVTNTRHGPMFAIRLPNGYEVNITPKEGENLWDVDASYVDVGKNNAEQRQSFQDVNWNDAVALLFQIAPIETSEGVLGDKVPVADRDEHMLRTQVEIYEQLLSEKYEPPHGFEKTAKMQLELLAQIVGTLDEVRKNLLDRDKEAKNGVVEISTVEISKLRKELRNIEEKISYRAETFQVAVDGNPAIMFKHLMSAISDVLGPDAGIDNEGPQPRT